MTETLDWYNCYRQSWKGEISPESFAHPAKFSRGLIRRIYAYLLDEGLLQAGDTVLDPFGGIGLGAADAVRYGINWVGIELEQRFVDFGGCQCTGISKTDWVRCYGRWERFNYKAGRHWCPACLAQAKEVIEAPPQLSLFNLSDLLKSHPQTASYTQDSGRIPFTTPHYYAGNIDRFNDLARGRARAVLWQGDSRELLAILGEIGCRGEGQSLSVIASPPFAGNSGGRGEASRNGIDAGLFERHQGAMVGGIGDKEEGNLASMQAKEGDLRVVITSPPYERIYPRKMNADKHPEHITGGDYGDENIVRYGDSEGQLAGMEAGAVEGVITSPPYVESLASDEPQKRGGLFRDPKRGGDKTLTATYGETEGQLGRMKGGNVNGDTFWGAARLIVEQSRAVLAEGRPAVFVTKDFVRKGKRVPFSAQWVQLCEACGFELVVHIRAWLVEERGAQYNLAGDLIVKQVERKSFFRRLAEKKGSPRIDWEDVLVFRAGSG